MTEGPLPSVGSAGEQFDAEALRARLAGRGIGIPLHYYPTVDSTNRVALGLAEEGAPEGTVVLADGQSAGKGRLQRVWQSPPGVNLYLSVLLRPAMTPAEAPRLTLTAGVAAAETLVSFCREGVGLKWPNDVRIGGRKVCGILTEMRTTGDALGAVVVGIGLNVNMAGEDFDPAHRETATSLLLETGRTHAREEVAFSLCGQLERWYHILLRDGFAPVREAWLSRSDMAGRSVRILFQDEVQEGVVAGIDRDGALLITDAGGKLRRIIAGDASVLK